MPGPQSTQRTKEGAAVAHVSEGAGRDAGGWHGDLEEEAGEEVHAGDSNHEKPRDLEDGRSKVHHGIVLSSPIIIILYYIILYYIILCIYHALFYNIQSFHL
jgi:hypothetical protein